MNSVENSGFKNKTIFFVPSWTEDFCQFVSVMKEDCRYVTVEKNQPPRYLLPYISLIYKRDDLYMEFELKKECFPDVYTFEDQLNLSAAPKVEGIKVACFSTGCVFIEIHVTYEGLTVDEIVEFSHLFKNVTYGSKANSDIIKLESILETLILEKAKTKIFFTAEEFKKECKMFHQIRIDESVSAEKTQEYLACLRRGYRKNFAIPKFEGDYDMVFEPYPYDYWAGSQEGLVNIFHYSGEDRTDKFLKKYKPEHLAKDYRFMYLVLLNQRFSAINYLGKTAMVHKYTRKEKEKLNLKTSFLKTTFSFSVVSDDQLYQTIYTKMYSILGIEKLLLDIRDNEEQVEILQNHEILENEKMTSRFLFALSMLSLFSVLVDAAGYFDRFSILKEISTLLSAGCLIGILFFYFMWWLNYRKK
jgi:hypothetical protein